MKKLRFKQGVHEIGTFECTLEGRTLIAIVPDKKLQVDETYEVFESDQPIGNFTCKKADGIIYKLYKFNLPTVTSRFEEAVAITQGETAFTYHGDDIIPDLQDMDDESIPFSDLGDVSACYTVLGPLKACYVADISKLVFGVSIKVGDLVIEQAQLDAKHPSISYERSYLGFLKWKIEFSLDIPNRKLLLSGKACIWKLKWKCKSFNIILFQW